MEKQTAIRLEGITKTFGDVVANDNVELTVRRGEILSLLGENGSGKTTLMNMLSGIYYPDAGRILVNGKEVRIRSPRDSLALGIGMIHQHFKLVDVLTAAENIVLGLREPGRYDLKAICAKVNAITEKYGFALDPMKKIYEMSISEKQTVEIVKVLYRGADILILDEPTAVLTPQETDKLFAVLRAMRDDGKAIIIITHKLQEVLSLSDRVSVLRKGKYVGTVETKDATAQSLTDQMVGEATKLNIDRPAPHDTLQLLDIRGLTVTDKNGVKKLDDVSFTVQGGEILGIAGIAGCGQKELLEAIAGLQPVESGTIEYTPPDNAACQLVGQEPATIQQMGVRLSFVPEDRLGMGLVANMDMIGNMMLRSFHNGKLGMADRRTPAALAEKVKEELDIVTPGLNAPVRRMSGGNVQKVLVGREIAAAPRVLMTAYAVRGLDINTSYTIYHLLNEQKEKGVGVIYVGEDLDVLLQLCDRVLVLCGGKVSGILDGRTATKEQVGLLMTTVGKEAAQ
ncbi:MAG: ABC transporter ATP-binding protein [Faecalibacterium sp.]|nr:ABC transporter ATP-binding protein [Faecalibacterium sp.]